MVWAPVKEDLKLMPCTSLPTGQLCCKALPGAICLEPAKAAVATATLLAMGKLHGLLGGDVSFLPL